MTTEEKKERARIANRKFYEKNKESEKARSKAWRLANLDKKKKKRDKPLVENTSMAFCQKNLMLDW